MYSSNFVVPISTVEALIGLAIAFILLVVKIYAFVRSLIYSAESYEAADKLNKATWTIILGVGLLTQLIPINLSIINVAFTVAALVFLADVRPALAGLRRR